MDAASLLVGIKGAQEALKVIATTLALTAWMWPNQAVVQNCSVFDYIIVGAGTAGAILANRLSENTNVTIIILESGPDSPREADYPGLFPLMPHTMYDWQYKSVNDGRLAQHTKNKAMELTAGKLLGGSSSLHHLIHSRGHPEDYDAWAKVTNDNSWRYENFLPYFNKFEKLQDKNVLDSPNGKLYGTKGPVKLTTEHSNITTRYLNAFEEIGHKILVDTNGYDTLGYTEPVLYIADGERQGSAQGYIRNMKSRPNYHLMKETTVIEIVFEGNCAKGVKAINNGETFTFYAKEEVIVSAGAFNTPKLLMLSGIGPKDHLQSLDIKVISNLPVGQHLQEHPSTLWVHKMGPLDGFKEPVNPHIFPAPEFIGYARLDKGTGRPDYQTTNLVFPQDSKEIIQLCALLFNFDNSICEAYYSGSINSESLLTVVNILHPKSLGKVELSSKFPHDEPLVYIGSLSDERDVEHFAKCLEDWAKIQESTFFKRVNATLVDLKLPECKDLKGLDFWKCYTVAIGNTLWHFSGTCSMGSVVDTELKVIGIENLRVVDASVIPNITSGNICAPVMAVAEKAADMIKKTHQGNK